jgi:hypothetical protein
MVNSVKFNDSSLQWLLYPVQQPSIKVQGVTCSDWSEGTTHELEKQYKGCGKALILLEESLG